MVAQSSAMTGLHSQINTPYSGFLSSLQGTRQTAWTATRPTFITLASDINTADTVRASALASSFQTQRTAVVDALFAQTESWIDANATRDKAETTAWKDLVTNLTGPDATYLGDVANAERDFRVAKAVIQRDFLANEDGNARDAALSAAATNYSSAITAAHAAFRSAADPFAHAFDVANANANLAHITTTATADYDFRVASLTADRDHQVATLIANATHTGSVSQRQSDFRIQEANTLSTHATALSASAPSPWATYEAQRLAADAARISATETASRPYSRNAIPTNRLSRFAITNAGHFMQLADQSPHQPC